MKKPSLHLIKQAKRVELRNSAGFSLLEILLSTTLLVVLATGTAASLSLASRGSVRNVERMQALMIVETKMAEMRRAYITNGSFPTGEDKTAVRFDMPSATKLSTACLEEDNVTSCDFKIKIGMRRIDVALGWVDRLGQSQTTSMVTYVYR